MAKFFTLYVCLDNNNKMFFAKSRYNVNVYKILGIITSKKEMIVSPALPFTSGEESKLKYVKETKKFNIREFMDKYIKLAVENNVTLENLSAFMEEQVGKS